MSARDRKDRVQLGHGLIGLCTYPILQVVATGCNAGFGSILAGPGAGFGSILAGPERA